MLRWSYHLEGFLRAQSQQTHGFGTASLIGDVLLDEKDDARDGTKIDKVVQECSFVLGLYIEVSGPSLEELECCQGSLGMVHVGELAKLVL